MLMLTEIYCFIDDFCKEFMPEWEKHLISSGLKKRNRKRQMSYAEVMTIEMLLNKGRGENFVLLVMRFWLLTQLFCNFQMQIP